MYLRPKRVFNPAVRKAVRHGGIKRLLCSYRNYAAIAYARTHATYKAQTKGVRTQKLLSNIYQCQNSNYDTTMFVLSTFFNSVIYI